MFSHNSFETGIELEKKWKTVKKTYLPDDDFVTEVSGRKTRDMVMETNAQHVVYGQLIVGIMVDCRMDYGYKKQNLKFYFLENWEIKDNLKQTRAHGRCPGHK